MINIQISELPIDESLLEKNTGSEEQQEMLRKIDDQRKRADPKFKGAFHDKKLKNQAPGAKTKSGKPKPTTPAKSQKPALGKGKKFTSAGKGLTDKRTTKRRG